LLPARLFAAVSTALAPFAGACLLFVGSAANAEEQRQASICEEKAGISVLASPMGPWKGAPLRVLFTAEQPLEGELSLVAPDGTVAAKSRERRGGPPYFWTAEVSEPSVGKWQARLAIDSASGDCAEIAHEIAVHKARPPRPGKTRGSVWPIRDSWSRATENLYSAWVEKLFEGPLDQDLSWPALHEVTRDPSRNLLFNYLGLGEDQTKAVIRPDCADLPYFLRAYFAFKLGLPYGYGKCTRGGGGQPPRCPDWWDLQNEEPPPPPPTPPDEMTLARSFFGVDPRPRPRRVNTVSPKPLGLTGSFSQYLQTVGNAVHSGNGRTAAKDNNTDYYPVPLKQETLRPGTVYADPYGHLLVLVRRVPQTADAAGILLSVDAQPDGTVARKRFWRGNFLFAQDPGLGGPGFKHFRPVVRAKNGALRRLSNDEIAKHPQYANYSAEQSDLGIEDFYDQMDDVISPEPLDPLRAMKEAITAFEEQVRARVTSVENGRKFQASGRGEATMPDGASIFETSGAWEDFATPSRDLRLLIAMDVVRGFPDRVARRPERYAMPQGKSVADVTAELQSVLASELSARTFSYTRSDGSDWKLALKDVLDRGADLELAYNPNDCVELRWGAAAKSEEAATCKRRAPAVQRAKMNEYRDWFRERRRPPRA
jgi:hypothetical protein